MNASCKSRSYPGSWDKNGTLDWIIFMTDKKTIWISGNPIDIATIFTLVSSKSEESRGEIALLGTRKVYKHLAFSEYSFKKNTQYSRINAGTYRTGQTDTDGSRDPNTSVYIDVYDLVKNSRHGVQGFNSYLG